MFKAVGLADVERARRWDNLHNRRSAPICWTDPDVAPVTVMAARYCASCAPAPRANSVRCTRQQPVRRHLPASP